jgi:hypothetical protein
VDALTGQPAPQWFSAAQGQDLRGWVLALLRHDVAPDGSHRLFQQV